MTLSKEDIKKYCTDQSLVCPYDEKNVQTCSYDLTFGGEYYFYREKDGNRVNIVRLRQGEKLYIPADAICYILTEETVQIPNNLTASISLSFGLIKKGLCWRHSRLMILDIREKPWLYCTTCQMKKWRFP